MADWWDDNPEERYWVEITDRPDVGADLKAPRADRGGNNGWSYNLIRNVWPGDIVFHYKDEEFVGASVAGGPLEARPIIWTPRASWTRKIAESEQPRDGWWLPLYSFTQSKNPLTLTEIRKPDNEDWIRNWITDKDKKFPRVAAPFQRYKGALRGAQGYLAKMPKEFVARWSQLSDLSIKLTDVQDRLTQLGAFEPPREHSETPPDTSSLDDSDYYVQIVGGKRVQSRKHASIVNKAIEWFSNQGMNADRAHPIDILLDSSLIIEVKTTGERSTLFAIREAVGQLLEYKHFVGPEQGELCVLIDRPPEREAIVSYVESIVGINLMWVDGEKIESGPMTKDHLGF